MSDSVGRRSTDLDSEFAGLLANGQGNHFAEHVEGDGLIITSTPAILESTVEGGATCRLGLVLKIELNQKDRRTSDDARSAISGVVSLRYSAAHL